MTLCPVGQYWGTLISTSEPRISVSGKHTYKMFEFRLDVGGANAKVANITKSDNAYAVLNSAEQEKRIRNGRALLRCVHIPHEGQLYEHFQL